MLEKSFGLFFFLKQPKNQKSDERYIYLRITVDGVSKELSTKRMWNFARWDQAVGRAKGTKEETLKLNAYLDIFRQNVYSAKSSLINDGKEITAEALKNFLTGSGEEKRLLLDIFKKHIEEIKNLIGKEYAYKTFQKYRTTFGHTKSFMKWKYDLEDVEIRKLDYEFVKDFSLWLKTIKNCNHNSTIKYIRTLKCIIIECMRKKWLRDDPFSDFKMCVKETEIIPLNNEELEAIRNKIFSINRLNLVKDIFVFSCYTGLAYVDVSNLKRTQIVNGIDGEKWIMIKRQKTDTPQRVPILPHALEIIAKYDQHPKCLNENTVLPILTNQKMNAYLKEIADICGIDKKLTFHIARHTFATTVTLTNGVLDIPRMLTT
ncbi:MAG: site-specific integrase [Taibaiella sp.]|nr:site-specific integrase [Taibaiella sp.]